MGTNLISREGGSDGILQKVEASSFINFDSPCFVLFRVCFSKAKTVIRSQMRTLSKNLQFMSIFTMNIANYFMLFCVLNQQETLHQVHF